MPIGAATEGRSDYADAGAEADGSPSPSIASSCDGDGGSDLDRYCSANSFLGSASICSSLGADFSESFRASDDAFPDRGDLRSSSFERCNGTPIGSGEGTHVDAEEDAASSSGGDCSAGEESIVRFQVRKSLRGALETKVEGGSPLIMNSSVAFGASDWDEFMRESEGDGLAPVYLFEDHPAWKQPLPPLMGPQDIKAEPSMRRTNTADDTLSETVEQQHDVRDSVVCCHRVIDSDPPSLNGIVKLEEHAAEFDDYHRDLSSIEELSADIGDMLVEKNACFESVPTDIQSPRILMTARQGKPVQFQEDPKGSSTSLCDANAQNASFQMTLNGISNSISMVDDNLMLVERPKGNELEVNDSFDEMVQEMEEILLDSGDFHGPKFNFDNRKYTSQQSLHFRDGSSAASTSGTDDASPLAQHPPFKIDWVEVVGANQKKGDVSFGERLVGVKEYTVYRLRVRGGNNQWEVERRYRDFFALYQQLKALFTAHGLSLPPPWSNVERESRKFFGNSSPDVVSERSNLIQDCLRSVLLSNYSFEMPGLLVSFLSPGNPAFKSSFLKALMPRSLQKIGGNSDHTESSRKEFSSMGKTITLVVEVRPPKSTRQMLELQHYTCAGCHKQLDTGKTFFQELAQTIGRNNPRYCEYTGQLFCTSCHTNDTAVLPGRVLQLWDFSLYPVSQLAKAYLESTYDQPMLCVSAVNPFLFSKVPALLHVMGVRKKIASMLPCIQCPFRRSIQNRLGVRKYLLTSDDFFALGDLVDLSKGAFAALPIMVETISNRILEHITQQCLVCYDAGIPCAARQACDDPLSLIFPFQEAEAAKCGSCGSIFHQQCFRKLISCACGKVAASTSTSRRATVGPDDLASDEYRKLPPSNSASGFISEIFSKARPDKIWRPKNSSPVILMGSLPSTSL